MKIHPPTRDLTLADVAAARESNTRARRQEIENRAAARREQAELERAHAERVATAQRELAADLDTTPPHLARALEARLVAALRTRHVEPIARDVLTVSFRADHVDLEAVTSARIVLAVADVLPPVRRNDAAFGGAAVEKRIRELPAVKPPAPARTAFWFEAKAREAGVPCSLYPQLPAESDADARRRVIAARDRGEYDPHDGFRNAALADRELELLAADRERERVRLEAEHRAQLLALRTQLLARVDAAVGAAPMGLGWWWLRDLRRWFAGERVRVTDMGVIDAALGVLGIKVFAGGAS